MICRRMTGMMTARHNIEASAWRCIISKSGCLTSIKPVYAAIRAPGQPEPSGAAGMKRGDIFIVMTGGRRVVVKIVIAHPSAAAYVGAASRTAGAAGRLQL
jgi:hypothetical protein